MDEVDAVVVGAGVVGLAVARQLTMEGLSVIVLEKNGEFGSGISSRNSEVIHAGIYYPENSLKAFTCVEGRDMLYRYAIERGVAHRRCGKFIVATRSEDISKLELIKSRAEQAGVFDLEWRTSAEVLLVEPEVRCEAALWSPSTGIIDSHAVMQSFLGDITNHGGIFVAHTPVTGIIPKAADGFVITVGGDDEFRLSTKYIVNCAGLGARSVANLIEGLDEVFIPPLYYSRGNYFVLSGKNVFSHLIYPVPEPGGLGVHVTIDLGGQARFGPDVEWIDEESYDMDAGRSASFYGAIRTYYPALPDDALIPGYCGIRPKLKPMGAGDSDFVISGPREHGIQGLINLFGIESPGLTASMSIANLVKSDIL